MKKVYEASQFGGNKKILEQVRCAVVCRVHGRGGDGTQQWHVGCCVRFALRGGGDRNG
jgi:hypothetical protein